MSELTWQDSLSISNSDNLDWHPVAELASLTDSVPILDIGALKNDADDSVVQEIAQACKDWGFFQVVNHGVSADLIDQTWQQCRQFFRAPAGTEGRGNAQPRKPLGLFQ